MYKDNSHVRLVTVKKDGSVEILFKDQTYMDIPKERVSIENKQRKLYTNLSGKSLSRKGETFWAREIKDNIYDIPFTVNRKDTEMEEDGDIYIKNVSSVKFE